MSEELEKSRKAHKSAVGKRRRAEKKLQQQLAALQQENERLKGQSEGIVTGWDRFLGVGLGVNVLGSGSRC